jgi:isoleucyl-tRNA synthetase
MLIQDVTNLLESYDPAGAALQLELFVDQLSKWYLRRSRRRFWKSEADSDKNAAYTTLYTSLVTLVKLLSPFTPFVTEEIYQNMVRSVDPTAPVSIHHCKWPTADKSLIDNDITSSMDLAVQACSLGHSARNDAGIKLRQPLSKAIIVSDETNLKRLETMKEVIKDEVNVKELEFASSKQQILEHKLKLRPQLLGAKYGKAYPAIKSKIESMDQSSLTSRILNGQNIEFETDDQPIIITPADVEVTSTPSKGLKVVEEGPITFALNAEITDDLRNEGLAHDIVRRIQNQRKEAGFEISEEIMVYFKAGPRITRVFTEFAVYIAAETLAKKMADQEIPSTSHRAQYSLSGETMEIGLERA